MVFIILFCVLLIVLIFLTIKYLLLKISIKGLKEDMEYLRDNATNSLIGSFENSKDIEKILAMYNEKQKACNEIRVKLNHEERELKTLLTNLSHDLRTPLTAIKGFLALLEKDEIDNFKREEYFKTINNRLEVIMELMEKLSEYTSYLETEKLEINFLDINPILEETLLLFLPEFAEKNIKPVINLLPTCFLSVDKLAIKRIFINILSNVIKYGRDSFEVTQKDKELIFRNKCENIDKIDIEKIFNRFFTVALERISGSSGLGLTISKMLAEKMHSELNAEIKGEYLEIKLVFKN